MSLPHSDAEVRRKTSAAVCNMKRGEGPPLEHMGRYVQPRAVGRNCRNNLAWPPLQILAVKKYFPFCKIGR